VPEKFKLLRVTLAQKPQDESIKDFVAAFRSVDLNEFPHRDNWP
jgi:hypothetical protein